MAPDGLRQDRVLQVGLYRFGVLQLLVGEVLLSPGEVGRGDLYRIVLPAVGEDGRVLKEKLRVCLPFADNSGSLDLLWCKGILEKSLHERQWRLKGEFVTEGVFQALFELQFSVVEVGVTRLELRVKQGLVGLFHVCVRRLLDSVQGGCRVAAGRQVLNLHLSCCMLG